eukprot:CAMPEP_0204547920 /NCGR_PEP_ID=MMETSP0661-20131031/23175_1 /ASSEMBLY_ACC=CAM_ASM_000606 /TAXON_ID=109239 /ORGANISM="Alexandrium margalefi, Strain AMGDE01CS-322" /LENGTH=271 /DNA_ID=CAMNT_0051554807 /DNA_START=1 /DNA_END=813 /DNA_ORIENTATION=+
MRRELMRPKERELQSVSLVLDSERLKDGDHFPEDREEVEVTAIFEDAELSDMERKRCLERLRQAGYGPMVAVEFKALPALARADEEVVRQAVHDGAECMKFVHPTRRTDREFILALVKRDPASFRYVDDGLKADREIATEAVERVYTNLQFAPDVIKDDRDIVRTAVQADGMMLKHASGNLQNDRDIVMLAVARSRDALKFASEALREDAEVLAARRPEREKTEMERAIEEAQKNQLPPSPRERRDDGSGVEYRPVTLMDRLQISIHNSSG